MSSLKQTKWHLSVSFLPSHSTQSSEIHGQTHQLIVWWNTILLSACQGEPWSQFKATREIADIWQASETCHGKFNLGNFQNHYLPELVVNVYNNCLMEKSVLLMCVEAGVIGMCVSLGIMFPRTHITRDTCFLSVIHVSPSHISLEIHVSWIAVQHL